MFDFILRVYAKRAYEALIRRKREEPRKKKVRRGSRHRQMGPHLNPLRLRQLVALRLRRAARPMERSRKLALPKRL